jgi:hypothetical protein
LAAGVKANTPSFTTGVEIDFAGGAICDAAPLERAAATATGVFFVGNAVASFSLGGAPGFQFAIWAKFTAGAVVAVAAADPEAATITDAASDTPLVAAATAASSATCGLPQNRTLSSRSAATA